MARYCGQSDLYDHGLPRGTVTNPGRVADSASASTDAFTLDVHGFDTDDIVTFRADVSTGGVLPTPLVAGVMYFAIPVTESTFKVSASLGGSAIDLTANGTRVVVIAPLPVDDAIEYASNVVDDMLPAHVVPMVAPYSPIVVMTVAEIAAWKLAARSGGQSKSLTDIVDAARKRLERWATGVPIRGENSPERSGLAASGSATSTTSSRSSGGCNDWRRFGGF
jgi:hypothetical protein